MEIEYLRTFCTTVEVGSMAKAAAVLGLTQPAVSQEIRALEAHLGVRLLDRTPQGVVPTDFGRIAYDGFRSILRTCGSVHDAIVRRRALGNPALRVGASAFPGGYIVPYALKPFAGRHPDVQVDLRVRPVPDLLSMVADGSLDMAVLDDRVGQEGLLSEVLGEESVCVVAAAGSVWDRPEPLSLEGWLALPHVLCDERCTAFSLFAYVAAQRLPTGRLRAVAAVESLEAAKAMVAAGVGVGVFPERAVRPDVQAERLRVLSVPALRLHVPVTAVRRAATPPSPVAEALLQHVRAVLRPAPRAVRASEL
jgi:DNA-binding transcriptional LysR family regulator